MEGFLTEIINRVVLVSENVANTFKRKEHDDKVSEMDLSLPCPKRKKLLTPSKYTYRTLFIEGKKSDITLIALEKHWRLHKVYLSQSPYFASMFSGSWREATEATIRIGIVDPNINQNSLHTIFGSLYLNGIKVKPVDVVAMLATATFFQLEGMISQCAEIMIKTINIETATKYYEAACDYGVLKVKEAIFKWLLINLIGVFPENPQRLLEIRGDLLEKLVSSPDLFVLETEFSLYTLLRFWLFLQFHPAWEIPAKDSKWTVKLFFRNRKHEEELLLTQEGKPFAGPFQALRFQHLINNSHAIETLRSDKIVPVSWITSAVTQHWCNLLRVDLGHGEGSRVMAEEEFLKDAIRCGWMISRRGNRGWSSTGFSMGVDLLWSYDSQTLTVRRVYYTNHRLFLVGRHTRIQLMYRVTATSLNKQRQVRLTQTSGLKTVDFNGDEEIVLLCMDKHRAYPMLVSVNLVFNFPAK